MSCCWNNCERRALDHIAAVKKDRTVERQRQGTCSSELQDRAARHAKRALACAGLPADSAVLAWVPPGWSASVGTPPRPEQ